MISLLSANLFFDLIFSQYALTDMKSHSFFFAHKNFIWSGFNCFFQKNQFNALSKNKDFLTGRFLLFKFKPNQFYGTEFAASHPIFSHFYCYLHSFKNWILRTNIKFPLFFRLNFAWFFTAISRSSKLLKNIVLPFPHQKWREPPNHCFFSKFNHSNTSTEFFIPSRFQQYQKFNSLV